MKLKITLLYGSSRTERHGIRAVRFLTKKLAERGHDVSLLDAKEYDLPILDRMYKEYEKGKAPEKLETIADILRSSDAFVFVTGEYNHGIQPGLKNLIDHFLEEYFWRPSAIVSYSAGSFGGVRAAMSLRKIAAEIGTPTIPSIFAIPKVQDSFDEDGKALKERYEMRILKFFDELEWYARAFKAERDKGVPY